MMSPTATSDAVAAKQPCRLCYYDSDDTVPIFDEAGCAADFVGKIARYLYLRCRAGDHLPQAICWMCKQHLTTFDLFDAKINAIQRQRLKDGYERLAIERPAAEVELPMLMVDVGVAEIEVGATESEVGATESVPEVQTDAVETIKQEPELEIVCRQTRSSLQRSSLVVPTEDSVIAEDDEDEIGDDDDENANEEDDKEYIAPTALNKTASPKTHRRPKQTNVIKSSKPPPTTAPRKRGRPPKNPANTVTKRIKESDNDNNATIDRTVAEDAADPDEFEGSQTEGESDDDFPAIKKETRDEDSSDDDETAATNQRGDTNWAALMAQGKFPAEMLRDGLLLFKGKPLMKIINRFYNLTCELCTAKDDCGSTQPLRFGHLNDLLGHYQTEHAQRGHVRCCDTDFSRYPAIIMHMARHLQPSAFRCEQCGYVVTRPRFLEAHRQTHLPEEQKQFACGHCERRFCWKRALVLHERKHTEEASERRRFVCQECGKM